MPTYRRIDENTLGITPDEFTVTRAQIEQQQLDVAQSKYIYDRDADALASQLNEQIEVLDS